MYSTLLKVNNKKINLICVDLLIFIFYLFDYINVMICYISFFWLKKKKIRYNDYFMSRILPNILHEAMYQ